MEISEFGSSAADHRLFPPEQVPGFFRIEMREEETLCRGCVIHSVRGIFFDRQDLNTTSLRIFVSVLISCNILGTDTKHDNSNNDDVIRITVIVNKTDPIFPRRPNAPPLLGKPPFCCRGDESWQWLVVWLRETDRGFTRLRCKRGTWTLWQWGCTYQILNF